jgi:hypothetical protein
MTLYINEIIGRLLQTHGFEHVLEKDVNKLLPSLPPSDARSARTDTVSPSRRVIGSDALASPRQKPPSEAGISVGLSRAFSFRKKPDVLSGTTNLRPLKLVEEQHPQPPLRSEASVSHTYSRTYPEAGDHEETMTTKRTSWVPSWFAKTGSGPPEK